MTYSELRPLFRHVFGKRPALALAEMLARLAVEGAPYVPPSLRPLLVAYRHRTHAARCSALLRYRRES